MIAKLGFKWLAYGIFRQPNATSSNLAGISPKILLPNSPPDLEEAKSSDLSLAIFSKVDFLLTICS